MKARHRKHRDTGVAEYAQDIANNPKSYTAEGGDEVTNAAKARKRGGKTVKMQGNMAKHHAGRTPRKNGGRAGSNMNPLSSAHSGTPAKGRSAKQID